METTRPPGRVPDRGVRASESVRVPLTPDELAWLDEQRGDTPRATWLRRSAVVAAPDGYASVTITLPAPYIQEARDRAGDEDLSEWTRRRWFAPVALPVSAVAPLVQTYIDREARRLHRDPTVAELLNSIGTPDVREAVAAILVAMEYAPESMPEPDEDESWRNE